MKRKFTLMGKHQKEGDGRKPTLAIGNKGDNFFQISTLKGLPPYQRQLKNCTLLAPFSFPPSLKPKPCPALQRHEQQGKQYTILLQQYIFRI